LSRREFHIYNVVLTGSYLLVQKKLAQVYFSLLYIILKYVFLNDIQSQKGTLI
jgi:hypothetical protein